jgi:nucleoside-diphosphate-sugar epimerase
MISLVTGASGFIGSHVVAELLEEKGGSVRALVRRADPHPPLPHFGGGEGGGGADVRIGDVRDSSVVQDAVQGVDVVYHCAAAAGPASSPREAYDISLTGTRNVLEGLRRAGTGRAVLLTGIIVLGARNLDAATEDLPYQRTGDPGSDVKIEIEQMAWDYVQRHGVDVTVLRPGMIYGPRDRRNLPQMSRALRRGGFAYIRSRNNVMPIVYITDMVQAMRLAARTPEARGRAYHITDGSSTPIGEFIDCLAGLLGCPPPQKELPFIVPYLGCLVFEWLAALRLYRGRPPISRTSLNYLGYSRIIDISRARRELGYEPRISYRDGLPLAMKGLEQTEPEA